MGLPRTQQVECRVVCDSQCCLYGRIDGTLSATNQPSRQRVEFSIRAAEGDSSAVWVLWKRKLRPRSRLQRGKSVLLLPFSLSLSASSFFLFFFCCYVVCDVKPNTHLDPQRCRHTPSDTTGSFRNKNVLTKQSKNTYIHKFELKFNHGYLQRQPSQTPQHWW